MKTLTRHLVVALMVCSAGLCARAQSQTKTPKKGSVAGKVTIKGKAVPGVVVGMRPSDFASQYDPSYKAVTDQDGKYRVSDVPAGSYQIFTVAPALVNTDIQGREIVVLSEGESVEGIDFALVRGGVITGKVTDAEGRPAVEQQVSLIGVGPDQPPNQRLQPNVLSSVQTDDRGIYRMFGLRAGRYKLAVGRENDSSFIVSTGRPAIKQTFYTDADDATDAAKATVVELAEGSEAANIDIAMGRTQQTFAASGRVVDGETGQPIPGARFGLQQLIGDQRASYSGVPSTSNSKGEFRLENMPPGKYAVFLAAQPDTELRSDPTVFEVVDQDVSDLLVKTTKGGASVSGNIVLANTEDRTAFDRLMQLRIQGYVQKVSGGAVGPNYGHYATINADGSFRLSGLEPGSLYFSLGAQDRSFMKGFTISRIERDGVVEPRTIEIKNGDQISGVRLVISYGNSIVRGVIKVENGELPTGARFSIRVTKEGETNTNRQPPQVDSRGHFIIEGLPGGLYYFEASVYIPNSVTGLRRPLRQQVNVVDGASTEVTLTVDMTPPTPSPLVTRP
jgi:hypothetical protein